VKFLKLKDKMNMLYMTVTEHLENFRTRLQFLSFSSFFLRSKAQHKKREKNHRNIFPEANIRLFMIKRGREVQRWILNHMNRTEHWRPNI